MARTVVAAVCRFAMDMGPLHTSDAGTAFDDREEGGHVTDGQGVEWKFWIFLFIC